MRTQGTEPSGLPQYSIVLTLVLHECCFSVWWFLSWEVPQTCLKLSWLLGSCLRFRISFCILQGASGSQELCCLRKCWWHHSLMIALWNLIGSNCWGRLWPACSPLAPWVWWIRRKKCFHWSHQYLGFSGSKRAISWLLLDHAASSAWLLQGLKVWLRPTSLCRIDKRFP